MARPSASKRGERCTACTRDKNRSFTGRDWALEAKDAHAGEVEIFEDPSAKGGAFANMYEERILPTEKSQMESFMQ